MIKKGGKTLTTNVVSAEAGLGLPEPQPQTSDVGISNGNKQFENLKI